VADDAQDFQLSPYTGWTRAHWEATADRMLLAVRRYAGPAPALIDLPGPTSRSGRWSDGLEGFARTFVMAAYRLAGAAGTDPLGLADWYAEGLTAGTDPSSPSRWPRLDEVDQAKVEAASIAIALHQTRPWIWDRLDDAVRERILDWFIRFAGAWVPDNNWVWFRAVVAAFTEAAGGSWPAPDDIPLAIGRTDDWYMGGGWYTDGDVRSFDHYNGWAMHLYPLWFCDIAGERAGPGLAAKYRSRLREYLADAPYLVGGDGAPLFQGRSLTYRFAALAPFWTGALFDATPLAPGLTRRIASGMLSYFIGAGCLRPDGTLSIGWHGEFEPIRQTYSGPGSPYWASKGFAGLLLAADHPVWRAVEEPLPVEGDDFVRTIRAPGWVVSGTAADGIVRIANHGTDHASEDRGEAQEADDPFYCRWAYSTATAPHLSGGDDPEETGPGGLDSGVALRYAAGRRGIRLVSQRRPLSPVRVEGHTGVSRHRARWLAGQASSVEGETSAVMINGPFITTASLLRGCWEVRAVRVDPIPGTTVQGPWFLRIGGWAVPGDEPPTEWIGMAAAEVSCADSGGLTGAVRTLAGELTPALWRAEGNAFGRYVAVAYLETLRPVEPGRIYAAGIALTGADDGPGDAPRVDVDGAVVRVTWADEAIDELSLDAATEAAR
jgi:hypothetical protein